MGGVSSVKGIILDFKNDDKNGLILGEDGNRYSFFYDTDWQNKITELKINSEVDFIVKDNKATEIYCLNNKNNDDISLNKNNIPFKKMDFDSIEKNGNDLSFVKDFRIRMFKYLSVSVVILVLGLFLIDKGLVYNWILYIISFISGSFSLGYLLSIIFPKLGIKDEFYRKVYSKELTVISYTPDNLNYEVIKMITINSESYESAKKELIRKAFKLKADAIFNLTHNVTSKSDIRTVGFNDKRIKTKITTTHTLGGVAIKLI